MERSAAPPCGRRTNGASWQPSPSREGGSDAFRRHVGRPRCRRGACRGAGDAPRDYQPRSHRRLRAAQGPGAWRSRSRRSSEPHHPGHRAGAAQRTRAGRVRRDLLADEAGRISRKASGVLDVLGRQPRQRCADAEPEGHISLVSGWQGDVIPTATNQTIQVPVATQPRRLGGDRSGPGAVQSTCRRARRPPRSGSARWARRPTRRRRSTRRRATLTYHAARNGHGRAPRHRAPSSPADWAFADCRYERRFPDVPDPVTRLPEGRLRFGRGSTSWSTRRRIRSSWASASRRRATSCRSSDTRAPTRGGTPNPVAGAWSRTSIALGTSQSGNFIKTFVHLGLQRGSRRPHRLGRHLPVHRRAADAAELPLCRAGRRGDAVRAGQRAGAVVEHVRRFARAAAGRRACSIGVSATKTCPKVFEAFGATEFWGLRMSPGLVGTDAARDIPLPDNVRRYYMPGTTHGGGRGGFQKCRRRPTIGACSRRIRTRWPRRTRALTAALVDWVVQRHAAAAEPLSHARRRDARAGHARGGRVSQRFPALPFTDHCVNAVLDYDFGSTLRLQRSRPA